jgi:WbqC-like protein family
MAAGTLVVLQPGYLPWLGFFDQMQRSSVFIYYDDVQFDKHGWRNRNRVKSPGGAPHWLTVPVLHSGRNWPAILEVEIDNRSAWARKHVGTLRQFYAKAPHLHRYLPELEELLERRWTLLVDLDLAVTELICGWLGLERRMLRASTLGISGKQSERLLALCQHTGVAHYLSGDSAKDYLDTELFAQHGIEIEWQNYVHPVYPQLHGDFVPYLSIVDLVFNCGEESAAILGRAGDGERL